MNFQQLRHFVVVAEEGNILGAAQRLNISQSGLSRSISTLENEMGLGLFERTPKGVILTEFGSLFLPRAQLIVNEHDRVRDEAKAYRSDGGGSLRIGTNNSFAYYIIPTAVARVLQEFPNAAVTLVTDTYTNLMNQLKSGQVDFVFSLYSDGSQVADCDYEKIHAWRTRVFAAANHPLRERKLVVAEDLAAEHWALIDGASAERAFHNFFADEGLATPKVSFRCASVALLTTIVTQANLLTLLPETFARRDSRLTVLPTAQPFGSASCGLIHRVSSVESPLGLMAAQAIRDEARVFFDQHPNGGDLEAQSF